MSKKYIFLTSFIINVGGGQIYCKNKSEYCTIQGFETFVFSTKRGNVVIENLKKYTNLINEELSLNPHCLSAEKFNLMLDWLCQKINYNQGDEIIIESHTPCLAVWGEMLAKRVGAKHIVYLLGEDFSGTHDYVMKFLHYKYSRQELACITDDVMKKLLNIEENCFSLNAALGDSVEDLDFPNEYIEKANGRTVIGIVGRGRKPYVFESVKKCCDFASGHKTEEFLILLVGGEPKRIRRNIVKYTKQFGNVILIFAGKQFPIPKKLLKLMNVAIAGAGCVKPPYVMGVPTISLDVYDNEAIGVYGYDTTVKLKREEKMTKTICEYLEEILYGDFLKENSCCEIKTTDFNKEYKKHFEFIENSSKTIEFYEFNNVSLSKKDKLFSYLYMIGGVKLIKLLKNQKQYFK